LLAEDTALRDAKVLRRDGGHVDIRYKQLDVSEDGSINDFVTFLRNEHKEGIDILHNNAGVALDGFGQSLQCQHVHNFLTTS
jgi:carbonyl reductase 1